MNKADIATNSEATLRQQAEVLARELESRSPEIESLEEACLLLREARVRQFELELQNEQLRQAHADVKRSAEILRESEERFHRLLQSVPSVAVQGYQPDGTIHYWNQASERIYGYTAHEALGHNLIDLIIPPEMREEARQAISQMGATGNPIPATELSLMRKDGSRVEVFSSHAVVPVAGREPDLFCLDIDLTEHKRMDAVLRESEERFRLLFERSPLSYQSLDAEGRYIEVNQAWLDTFGYTRQEVIGRWFGEFLQEADAAKFGAIFEALKQSGEGHGEYEMRRKDGAYILAAFNTKIGYDRDRCFKQTHCILHDITELRRIELERQTQEVQTRQIQKAESLGRMAGAIAHHFNNQLETLMLSLEMARADLARNVDASEILNGAMQAARRAAEVSGFMLTYIGQTQGSREPVDLAETCRQLLPLIQVSIPAKTSLETEFCGRSPVVKSDASQIKQILNNLLTNAWEALDGNLGRVRLTVACACPGDIPSTHRFPIGWLPQEPEYACIKVSDTGSGIARSEIEKVFDPFYSSKFIGRGLGLPVVLGIARAHAGCVTVESEPGRGSVFCVFLPLCAGPVPPKPIPPASASSIPVILTKANDTILLVEDESSLRKVAAGALRRLGFKVFEAQDGVEAVEMFQRYQTEINLVFCDLTMPRKDGWETIAAIRQLNPAIPVILTSGYDESVVMSGNHPDKPQAFLSKPYEFETFCEILFQVLKTNPPE